MLKKKETEPWPLIVYQDPNQLKPDDIDPCSLCCLGHHLLSINKILAFKYILKAADKGLEEALYLSGNLYLSFTNEDIPESEFGKLPNMERAIQFLERNIELWESERSYITLADLYHKTEKYDIAIQYFKTCYEKKGTSFAAIKLGEIYSNIFNDKKNALFYYKSISDKSALASINVAIINYPEHIEETIEYYENALKIDPNFDTSKLNMPTLKELKEEIQQKKVKDHKNHYPVQKIIFQQERRKA